MTLLLVLGFVVVVSGLVFRYRGGRTTGLVLVAAAFAGCAVSVIAGGRDGVGELVVGGLAGLPLLIAGALAHDRKAAWRGCHLGSRRQVSSWREDGTDAALGRG